MGLLSTILGVVTEAGEWLLLGNVGLAALLAASAFRYHRLRSRTIEEQAHQRDLIENLSEGIYRSSPGGHQLSANKALVRLNGYSAEAEMLDAVQDIGIEWYVDPKRRDEFRAILMRQGRVQDFVSEIYRHKTRERIWITESARLVRHKKTGQPLFYEGSVREITETVRKLKLEELFNKLSSQVPGGLFQFVRTHEGQYSMPYASEGYLRIFGFSAVTDFNGDERFIEIVHEEDRASFATAMRESGQQMKPLEIEFRVVLASGQMKWVRCTAQPEAVEDGIMWHGYVSDISLRKKNETEIEKLAFYDPLTGLPNRRKFMDRMNKAVADSMRHTSCGAVIFIDLDNFKILNDTRGHDVGDQYLVEVAARLKSCVRPSDMVARIGGDEFVIIIQHAGAEHASAARMAIMTANKVLAELRSDFEIGQFKHRSSASLGVVVFDGNIERPEEIVKQADIAMYQAKAAGRNGMALYDHISMSTEADRYRLLNDLKAAMTTDALTLHYQPQVDENGRIVGAEALCRWHHPELGTLLPERFVPLTEQFGLIREFGNVILTKGVAELARWRYNAVMSGLRMAINVNVQSFYADDFVPNLQALLNAHGVDAKLLTLELTENVMAKDSKLIARRMHELKELGVRLSLDDFGSGYSSLAQLKRLPFDELKIDGCFIADIESGESDRALVKSMLGTARTLKLTAVAEHVENVRQEAFLRAFGCDFFQGYLYSQPLSRECFVEFVERRNIGNALLDMIEERQRA